MVSLDPIIILCMDVSHCFHGKSDIASIVVVKMPPISSLVEFPSLSNYCNLHLCFYFKSFCLISTSAQEKQIRRKYHFLLICCISGCKIHCFPLINLNFPPGSFPYGKLLSLYSKFGLTLTSL